MKVLVSEILSWVAVTISESSPVCEGVTLRIPLEIDAVMPVPGFTEYDGLV